MNVVNQYGENWNGFAEVAAFYHVTCRYFNRFLLQGVNRKIEAIDTDQSVALIVAKVTIDSDRWKVCNGSVY